jgi:Protein of unknown function (DUF3618)
MADNTRTPEQIRLEIATERAELASAVDELRSGQGLSGAARAKLPVLAAGAAGAGFVLAGGIGASMRLIARRGREGKERARLGPFSIVDRR